MVFAQRFMSFLHPCLSHQRIKSLKCFTGYTLGARRPRKYALKPHLKTSKIAAGADARDIFALDSRIDFGVTSLKCFIGWSLCTSRASCKFSFFSHAGRGMQIHSAKHIKSEEPAYLCPNAHKTGLSKFTNVFNYFSEVHRFMLAHFHFWASFSRDAHSCHLRQILCFIYFPAQGALGAAQRANDGSSQLPVSAA